MLSEPLLDEPRDGLEGAVHGSRLDIALVILAHAVDDDASDVDPEHLRFVCGHLSNLHLTPMRQPNGFVKGSRVLQAYSLIEDHAGGRARILCLNGSWCSGLLDQLLDFLHETQLVTDARIELSIDYG